MSDELQLFERPQCADLVMIAGWEQWADAGSISSGLPRYLIELTGARKIGEIPRNGYYLFQMPGTHHLLRPVVNLEDGLVQGMQVQHNEIYFSGDEEKGLLIFLGEEPHMDADRYSDAFFKVVSELGVRRVALVGGVYGAMPYQQERDVSCSFSLPHMRAELDNYALRYSNYEGGTTIGTYLVHQAAEREVELLAFYAFVPAYDFGQVALPTQGVRIEDDVKAWYDLLRRFNHMFTLGLDLSDLHIQSDNLAASMDEELEELERKVPQLNVKEYMAQIEADFQEKPFMPLDDVWERELGDLFNDLDE